MSIDLDSIEQLAREYPDRAAARMTGATTTDVRILSGFILALIAEVRALRGAVALTEDEREALLFARVLLGVNPLGFHSHDPVVIEHDKKCGAALALLDKLGGAR